MTTQTSDKKVKLWTPVFRGAYPQLFKARAASNEPGAKEKYSVVMIWPEVFTDPAEKALFEAMRAAVRAEAVKKWGDPAGWPTTQVPNGAGGFIEVSAIITPFHSGLEKKDKDGFGPGVIYATASTDRRPGVLGPDGSTHLTEPAQAYGGAYYRATMHPYAYEYRKDGKGPVLKRGITLTLHNVQFVRDGEPFAGASKPEEDFDAITPPVGATPVGAALGGLGV